MNKRISRFIVLILFIVSFLFAKSDSLVTFTTLNDTCISGYKIMPERSFGVSEYSVNDSMYSRAQVMMLLTSNQYSGSAIKSATVCATIGTILCITGSTLASVKADEVVNNMGFGLTVIGVDLVGITFGISSIKLFSKGINDYNRSLCKE